MKSLKDNLRMLPEIHLMILLIIACIQQPIALVITLCGFMLVVAYQLICQNRIIGIISSILLSVGSMVFLLALISEYNEFTSFTVEARNLLLVGLLLFMLSLAAAVAMFFKYTGSKPVVVTHQV